MGKLELTSKQRAALRAIANTYEPVLQIGKDGITEPLIKQAEDALTARELIKVSLMKNAPMDTHECCDLLCEKVHASPVQCIGNRFIIFRRKRKESRFVDVLKG